MNSLASVKTAKPHYSKSSDRFNAFVWRPSSKSRPYRASGERQPENSKLFSKREPFGQSHQKIQATFPPEKPTSIPGQVAARKRVLFFQREPGCVTVVRIPTGQLRYEDRSRIPEELGLASAGPMGCRNHSHFRPARFSLFRRSDTTLISGPGHRPAHVRRGA